MQPDDELCLCFHVTRRKVQNFLRLERPQRESQLAECYGAGTETAQSQIDAMFICFDDYCGSIADDNQWQQCVETNCGAQIDTCFGG